MIQFSEDTKAFYEEYMRLSNIFYGNNPPPKENRVRVRDWDIEYITGPVIMNALNQLFIMRLNDFYTKKKDPLIIDCGANIGLSILSCKYRHPGARIKAFEADPAFFKVLQRNMENNKVSNVKLLEAAAWIENANIEWGSDSVDGSRILGEGAHSEITKDKKKILVKCCDLAEYLNEEVDLLKLDIEGAEYRVIKHLASRDVLKNVSNIIIECHLLQSDFKLFGEALADLKDAGFKLSVNNMGRWRDLVRRPEFSAGHYEQYLLICGWRDDEFPNLQGESEFLPFMGSSLMDMEIVHRREINRLETALSVNCSAVPAPKIFSRLAGLPKMFLNKVFRR